MKQSPLNLQSAPLRQVYLLTCWRERDEVAQTGTWRFKLEIPGPNQPRLFKTMGEVMTTIETDLQRVIHGDK